MNSKVDYAFIAADLNGNEIAEFRNPTNRYWSRFLSAPGEASFTIRQKDPMAADAYIGAGQMQLHIRRKGTLVWGGVIDALKEDPYTIQVHASSWEQLLAYQLTSYQNTYTSKRIGTEIVEPLWDSAKATGNSRLAGFTSTTIQNPYVSAAFERYVTITFDYENLLSVFQKMVEVGRYNSVSACDFYITPSKDFNFYRNLGTQQSEASYILGGSVRDFKYLYNAKTVRNRVVGVGVGAGASLLSSTQSDATSQTTYHLMEEAVPFKDIDVQGTLDAKTQDFLASFKNPSEALQITVQPGYAPFEGYSLGDQIKINIVRGHTNLNDVWYRVIGMKVLVTDEGSEVVQPILNKPRS